MTMSDKQVVSNADLDVFEEHHSSPVQSQSTPITKMTEMMQNPSTKNPPKKNKEQLRKKEWKRSRNYEEASPLICNIFFCFYFPYVCRIKPLMEEDIPEIASNDKSELNTQRLRKNWIPAYKKYAEVLVQYEEEKKKLEAEGKEAEHLKKPQYPSLLKLCLKSFVDGPIVVAFLSMILATGLQVCMPTMMQNILKAAVNKMLFDLQLLPKEPTFPYSYAIILICCPFFHAIFDSLGNRIFFHFAGKIRASFCGLIFEKTLLLNISSQSNLDTGRLLTLISADARIIADMMPMFLMLVMVPIMFIVPLVFTLVDLGAIALIAFAVVIVLMPLIILFLMLAANSMKDFLRLNDLRTKRTNETVEGIRVVKFSGLEGLFINRIEDARRAQVKYTSRAQLLMQCIQTVVRNIPGLVNFCVAALFVYAQGHPATDFVSILMADMGYLSMMTSSCTVLPMLLQAFVMMSVSFKRINDFLVLPEMRVAVRAAPVQGAQSSSSSSASSEAAADPTQMATQSNSQEESADAPIVFQIENGVFEWDEHFELPKRIGEMRQEEKAKKAAEARSSSPSPSPPASSAVHGAGKPAESFRLRDINLSLRKGTLTMVIGTVGCGKSSLGTTVVGDIGQKAGEVRIGTKSIAYCPQNSWIINGTVKENIMLADDSDSNPIPEGADEEAILAEREERYQHTVHVCALEADFQILAAGDMTAIGEKGVNLSGGQKARIQLARAVYADRDFYVLDDVLSAVDAHVGRFLFDECIMKELRDKGKTVMLMTNQLQYLSKADHVVVLDSGTIIGQGTYKQLKKQGINFDKFFVNSKEEKKSRRTNALDEAALADPSTSSSAPLDQPALSDSSALGTDAASALASELSSPESTPSPAATPQPTPLPTPEPTPTPAQGEAEERRKVGASIMTEEEQETGGIPWAVHFKYLWTIAPHIHLVVGAFVVVLNNVVVTFFQYWMGVIGSEQWSSAFSYHQKLAFFGYLIVISIAIFFLQGVLFYFMERRGGLTLHTNLVRHVTNAPSSFFDTTPLGRTLNRFTGDLTQVDIFLLMMYSGVVSMWLSMVGQIVIVAVDEWIFVIVGVVTIAIYFFVVKLYSRAARNFQRLESMARSPVLSVFSECLTGAGLTTIRAYGLEKRWTRKFNRLNDDWTARFVVFREGQKWATLYASFLSSVLLVFMVVIGWNKMEASKMAIAISSGMMFGMLGVQIVQQNVSLEARLTGLQRVFHYSKNLPQEIPDLHAVRDKRLNIDIADGKTQPGEKVDETSARVKEQMALAKKVFPPIPPSDLAESWPSTGSVEFDHVSYRYRPGLPYVLKDICFSFRSGEKVGICGRTGAGKSSLIFPLFRLAELDPRLSPERIDPETGFLQRIFCDPASPDDGNTNRGRILIDSVDIATINIHRVRSSLAIIPQDPTLFTGTLRSNLDLSGACSDDEIWEVLEMVSLKEVFEKELDKGLDTEVTEGGRNFSCGQRQLICFGRALLQKTKVVLMDEATANVDVETDAKIQHTIRDVLKEQTVIVVAHRLNTIMGSDRILVMDKGQIVELDTPANLLANPGSAFNSLVNSLSN